MRSSNEVQIVDMIKFWHNFAAIKPPCTSGRHRPSFNCFRIGPHQVTHDSRLGYFLSSINISDLIYSFNFGRKTTMQTEYLLINDCTQPQIVKDFGAILPRLSIAILLHNLVIKPILLTNSATFVIASQQCDTRWIFDLQAQQELKCLHRVVASIDVITHKDVPRVWNLPTFVE